MELTRRTLLRTLAAAGVVAGTARVAVAAEGAPALGRQETVAEALARLFGNRPIGDGAAFVKLDVPPIAENGASVPTTVEVASPMTAADHIKTIYIVADKNRIPVVARVSLTPEAGQAYAAANIRLGETGDVRAIAEKRDGSLWQTVRLVKVTVGGCGG